MSANPKSIREHPEFVYSGTEELIRIEKAMIKYNEWIIGKVGVSLRCARLGMAQQSTNDRKGQTTTGA